MRRRDSTLLSLAPSMKMATACGSDGDTAGPTAAFSSIKVLVVIGNHPNAGAVRPVVDALIDWTTRD